MRRKSITDEQKQEYRRVAYYYYKEGLTQEEIAKRMQMSRQRVNRIISSCIELGIVTINIEGLDNSNLELETKLEQKYGLKEVRVIDEAAEEMKIQELGIEGGKYLRSILKKRRYYRLQSREKYICSGRISARSRRVSGKYYSHSVDGRQYRDRRKCTSR